ncbi:methyltransferase [Apiospora rasikravindrae]|uniref:protein-histidine N-methyltransferase n=1 Tax=Apiospora rasikravindrae TaxID=990691 RepID=A0ABR1T6P5_9PEZI
MSGNFSFSFGGDDIDEDEQIGTPAGVPPPTGTGDAVGAGADADAVPSTTSAFPVAGKPLLPPTHLDLASVLGRLPSTISYSLLDVVLDSGETIQLPRRELWDVRVQLMAEDGDSRDSEAGLGSHDVKTGVYEGGFKSWESSVDLVKVLAQSKSFLHPVDASPCVIELGCGTALPSLALFQWVIEKKPTASDGTPLSIILADYNSAVLELVTLPNFLIAWARQAASDGSNIPANALSSEGELEITQEIVVEFKQFLAERQIRLNLFSGAWSPELVGLMSKPTETTATPSCPKQTTTIIGAETIYSPFALQSFTDTTLALMEQQKSLQNSAELLVGAKKLYFGVGGSLDDFVSKARERGAKVEQIREETEGVRRGVVRCVLP